MTQVPAPNHRLIAVRALTSGRGRGLGCVALIAVSVGYAIWTVASGQPVTHWQYLIATGVIIILAVSNIAADQVIRILAKGFLLETTYATYAAYAAAADDGSIRPPGNGGTG